ncbi:MAG: glycosyltransferase [Bdellovibrionales bacterium]|nr:glycosyltransferase [Bdellovibrionales bacterium]
MRKIAVVSFVKTPGLSPVKTRLAATIGKENAERVFQHCIQKIDELLTELQHITGLDTFWAVAEKSGLGHSLWRNHSTLLQQGHGLGERLHHIYEPLKKEYDVVYFIGADSPQLTVSHLRDAEACLMNSESDFVFGPTPDGGFYLFGGQRPLPNSVWTDVTYSAETTLDEISTLVKAFGKVGFLQSEYDIDLVEDLKNYDWPFPLNF